MVSRTAMKWGLVGTSAILIVISLIGLSFGIAMLTNGGITQHIFGQIGMQASVSEYEPNYIERTAHLLLTASCFGIIFGVLGIVAAFTDSFILLIIFLVLMLLALIMEIIGLTMTFVYRKQIENSLMNGLEETIKTGYFYGPRYLQHSSILVESPITIDMAWDYAQIRMQCCGVNGPSDYTTATNFLTSYLLGSVTPVTGAVVPMSCCKFTNPEKYPDETANLNIAAADLNTCLTTGTGTTVNTEGCYDKLLDLVLRYTYTFVGIACVATFVGILAIVFTAMLLCTRKRKDYQ